jgi:hypothetical protein
VRFGGSDTRFTDEQPRIDENIMILRIDKVDDAGAGSVDHVWEKLTELHCATKTRQSVRL